MGDTTYHLPGGIQYQPDACFCPEHVLNPGAGGIGAANPQGDAWPTLVVEVYLISSALSPLSLSPALSSSPSFPK
jgi:hypothetical protein